MFKDLIGKGIKLENIGLYQGYIKEDGTLSTSSDTDHSKYVTTDFIDGGIDFLCYLNDHYFVNGVALFDSEGNFLCQKIIPFSSRRYKKMQEFSFHLNKKYKMRLSIVHNESEEIGLLTVNELIQPELDVSPTDDVMNQFCIVDKSYFTRVPSDDPFHDDVLRREEHVCSIPTDRGKYPAKVPADQGTPFEFGVVYADQNETPGRVGTEVSPYTYITACHNPRSVMHTEKIRGKGTDSERITEYGFEYKTTNDVRDWAWYGMNCSNCVTYCLGWYTLPTAGLFIPGTSNGYGTTEITPQADGSNLKPFDVIVSTAHIWVITNIWKDANGNVRFIETAESGGGNLTTAITMFSLEAFLYRVTNEASGNGYHIARIPKAVWARNEPLLDYMPNSLTSDFEPVEYNDDICTFQGDKVEWLWGNIMYLNVQRNRGWENVVIKKWDSTTNDYEPFQTIDITVGNNYPTKLRDGDWCDINIGTYYPYNGGEYGKYIAYCTADNGYNLWDKTTPLLTAADGKGYWIDLDASSPTPQPKLKKWNSGTGFCWAIPCKPNTTYLYSIPSQAAYDSTLLRFAWANTDLSFLQSNSNFNLASENITVGSTQADGTFGGSITTGADATYLFMYSSDIATKSQYLMDTLVLKEQGAESIKSKPTKYEVLAFLYETDYLNGVSTTIFKEISGKLLFQCFENGSGFCRRDIPDTYRFYRPVALNYKNHCWTTETGTPDSSHGWSAFRVRGQYGTAKLRSQYSTPTNYWDTSKTTNKNIDMTTGTLTDNDYRDVVVIDDVSEGDSFCFITKRVLTSDYFDERYAFYDSNDQLVGDVTPFYDQTSVPSTGTLSRWFMVVPAGATKLKVAVLKGNSKQQVFQTQLYFPPEE